MAVQLDVKGFDPKDPAYRPMLAQLQANILKSHARDFVRLLFLQFQADDDAVKAWISKFSRDRVKSALDQQQAIDARRAAKANSGSFDGGLMANFFLTAEGYEDLGFDADHLKETAVIPKG